MEDMDNAYAMFKSKLTIIESKHKTELNKIHGEKQKLE